MVSSLLNEVRYCLRCGGSLLEQERFGRLRPTCPHCDWIYFADPKVAAAVLVEQDQHVLLVRRAIDPYRGFWTLPAGFVDADEDPRQAAVRECLEETGLQVRVTGLLDVLYGQEHPRGAHILIAFLAEVVGGEITPADDVDGADWFRRDALPPLAFRSTEQLLKY